jgi:hypothetical protein
LSFSGQVGGASPPSQTINVTDTNQRILSWTATPDQSWLSVNPTSGNTPGSFTVSVSTAGLAVGTYNGTITITSPQAENSPWTLPVNFGVGPPGPTGLVAAYGFSEGFNTTVADSSGNPNIGTLTNEPVWTTQGKYGNAITFDGVNDFVLVADNVTLDLAGMGTIETWVRLNAINRWNGVIAKGNANSSAVHNYGVEITDTNRVRCILGNGVASQEFDSTITIAANQFRHLACTWNGTTLSLYIDGVLNNSTAQTITPAGNTSPLYIGQFGGNSDRLSGIIDEVRIYNRALSQAEIQQDMNTPISTASNTAPTITTIAAQATNEDAAMGAVPFTVGDTETAAGSLTVSGTSSNTTLVPNGNIVFGGSGANRTVTVTPAANQNGSANITVTVSDGSLSTPTSFQLTVNAANDAPTITGIANQTTTAGTAVGPLNFTVGDVETAVGSLAVSGSSNNTTLVPNGNISFGGSGANRTVTVTPAAGQAGTATITVTVSDGSLSTPTSFQLTVNASTNTAPGISSIGAQVTNEDTPTGSISFTVGDAETAVGSLVVSGSSNNTTLVPNGNIAFGGSGANRTVTITPAANQNGIANITVTVSDGSLSTPTSFQLTVNAVNDAPTVTAIANQTTTSGTAVGPLSFTMGDVETSASSLTVSGSSNNTTVVPTGNITFGGSGASRTVTVTPAAGQTGTANITVTVSDGQLSTPTSFQLTVNAVPSGLRAAYAFSEGVNTTAADSSGNANTGTLTNGPVWTTQGKYGNAITFDGVNDFVSVADNATLDLAGTGTIEAWVRLNATNWWHGVIAKGNANNSAVHNYGIEITDTNRVRCILGSGAAFQEFDSTITIAANQFRHVACTWNGTTLSLYIDSVLNTSTTQNLTPTGNTSPLFIGQFGGNSDRFSGVIDEVRIYNRALSQAEIQQDMNTPISTASNAAPTISAIGPQVTNEDTATGIIPFTVGDTETPVGSLTVSGNSSNATLVPNGNIVFGGSGANRTVTITPAANQNGTANITVTVSDGSLSTPTSFQLTVNAVNDAPTITGIANQTTTAGTAVGPLNFTVGDLETAAGSLTLSGSSNNAALVLNANITFSGASANRTVTVTPVGGQTGTANITVTVSDGTLSTPTSFQLMVLGANTAPTITSIATQATNEDTATGAIPFTVGDTETPVGNLVVSGTSSNTTLVPNGNIVFGGSGANRTVTVTPAANQTGTANITVTVSDGSLSTPTSFQLTVNAISSGLRAAYAFNEGINTTTGDASGNANTGTLTNGPVWTTQGRYGNAITFDGVNDFVSVPDNATLDLGGTGTIEAWVRPNAINRWNSVVAKGNSNSDSAHNYALEITDANRARCVLGSGTAGRLLDSTVTIAAGQFRHLACTWNGTTLSLYIDGVLNNSTAQAITPGGNTSPLYIGQFGGNADRLNGTIDEVRIYNRALSQAEIQQDTNTPIP